MKDYGMYQGYNVENAEEVNINSNQSIDINTKNASMNGCVMPEVVEGIKEKQIHRTICHTVPHICPVHTRIINHHVYKHVYTPYYTCSEENEICNVDPGCTNLF